MCFYYDCMIQSDTYMLYYVLKMPVYLLFQRYTCVLYMYLLAKENEQLCWPNTDVLSDKLWYHDSGEQAECLSLHTGMSLLKVL